MAVKAKPLLNFVPLNDYLGEMWEPHYTTIPCPECGANILVGDGIDTPSFYCENCAIGWDGPPTTNDMGKTEGEWPVINRLTGQPPTAQEQREIDTHAIKILSSPYSAPEQVAWAINCASPTVVERWFFQSWESHQQRAIRERRQHSPALPENLVVLGERTVHGGGVMDTWIPLTPDAATADDLTVYKQDYLGHHIADGCQRDPGEYDKARWAGANHIILEPDELGNVPPIRALIAALTGHEDRSLWWLGYVKTLVREYERSHDWATDDDPQATAEAIDRIKTGLVSVEEALEPFGIDLSPCFYPTDLPAYSPALTLVDGGETEEQ